MSEPELGAVVVVLDPSRLAEARLQGLVRAAEAIPILVDVPGRETFTGLVDRRIHGVFGVLTSEGQQSDEHGAPAE